MLTLTDLRGSSKQRNRERLMRLLFQGAAIATIVISLLIVFVLFRGAINFLQLIGWDLGALSDNGWFPRRQRFDLRTIVWASVVMGAVAMLVAVPLGLGVAVYLSEYASRRARRVIKPIVEVLAGVEPELFVGACRKAQVGGDDGSHGITVSRYRTLRQGGRQMLRSRLRNHIQQLPEPGDFGAILRPVTRALSVDGPLIRGLRLGGKLRRR